MRSELRDIDMGERVFADLTAEVGEFVSGQGDGLVNVFVPHATASLALMETGSGSEDDLAQALERLLPRDHPYRHSHGSTGHGADHVVPAFLGSSLTVPVIDGKLQLGTWQSVVLVDTNRDNARRRFRLSLVSG